MDRTMNSFQKPYSEQVVVSEHTLLAFGGIFGLNFKSLEYSFNKWNIQSYTFRIVRNSSINLLPAFPIACACKFVYGVKIIILGQWNVEN